MSKRSKTFLTVVAVFMLSLCTASQASADSVTLKNGLEEPVLGGAAIELRGGGAEFASSVGGWECAEFSLMAEVGTNQSDPLTMDVVSGVLQGDLGQVDPDGPCIIEPTGVEVFYSDIISTEELTLNSDGTGELPIELVETRLIGGNEWHCTRTGTIPLSWEDNAGEFSGADVFPDSVLMSGSGGCAPYQVELDATPFELFDEEGAPVELVVE